MVELTYMLVILNICKSTCWW